MEVFLYNSTVCRLCGEENDNGTLLYSCEENNQNLSEVINTYLPIKVSDDGELPRTICPGCTIQLEATIEFLNLIINGQKILKDLHQREKEYKKSVLTTSNTEVVPEIISENIVYEINTNDGVYQVEHPISLQIAGLNKPKRKRGRPPKKPKTPEELAQEAAAKEQEAKARSEAKDEEEPCGKRRRKTPTRFKEAVQGKELEQIFLREGVIDNDESDHDIKVEADAELNIAIPKEPEVIGHLEASGELVVVVKGKGRGRPKGRTRQTREQCAICGKEFSSTGRYMSHVAQHGPVQYRCDCALLCPTRLALAEHQRLTGHEGHCVEQHPPPQDEAKETSKDTQAQTKPENIEESSEKKVAVDDQQALIPQALPDLSEEVETKTELEARKEDDVDVVGDEPQSTCEVKVSETLQDVTNEDNELNCEATTTVNGKVKLKCNQCDKVFNSRQSKSLHIKAAHLGEKPHTCVECGASFAYPRSLALHRVSHRRHRAPFKGYACDLCGKVLNHPSSVVYHKQAAHAAQRYVCGTCGKHFRHKQLLTRHQLVHSQARPYTCKTCSASFKTKANLLNHQLLHSGVKKFSCELCKHRFAHKTSLTLHMRWHQGVKPFTCDVCGKSFSQKGNLSEHERIHTGEKPYQCALCPRRFTTSSQHRLHLRRHASRAMQERHACGKCGRRFLSRSAWEAHARREREDGACTVRGVRRTQRHHRHKPASKQISLLVQKAEPVPSPAPSPQQVTSLEDDDDTEERVIYVAYEDDNDAPAFHILDPDQTVNLEDNKVLTTCELYSGSSLLVPQQLEQLQIDPSSLRLETAQIELESEQLELEPEQLELAPEQLELEQEQLELDPEQMELEHEQLELDTEHEMEMDESLVYNGDHMPVTDEQGNPLHFTMQDGTKLAITSVDGKSLQVVTQDGQTIPVEINGYNDDEEATEGETVVRHVSVQAASPAHPAHPPHPPPHTPTATTHYFTIV